MTGKSWGWAVPVLLLAGSLGLDLHGAPGPAPEPEPQVGRFVPCRKTIQRNGAKKEKYYQDFDTLLDSATGRLWTLQDAGGEKPPKRKWVPTAEAPKVPAAPAKPGRFVWFKMTI